MDQDAAYIATGEIFSEAFDVEDGWAHFNENYANGDGEMNKAQFGVLVENIVRFEDLIMEQLAGPFKKIYKTLGGNADDKEKMDKSLSKICKKVPTYLPLFVNALFRYFDADGSGTISKDEVCLAIGGCMGPNGPDPMLLLPGLFRTLDADNSNSIEAVELQPFITEIITALSKLITRLVNEFETDLKGGLKKKVLKRIQKLTEVISADEEWENEDGENIFQLPISKATIVNMAPRMLPDWEDIQEMGVLQPLPSGVIKAVEGFFAKFTEAGEGKPLSIKACAQLMETFTLPIVDVLNPELSRAGLEMLIESQDLEIDLDDLPLDDLLPIATSVMKSYLKSGAQKRWFAAFISFLDVNNDGDISMEELRGIWHGGLAVIASTNEDEYNTNVSELLMHVFDIFDSDGSGQFDMDDAPQLYDKCVELVAAFAYLWIELFKSIALALVLPGLNVCFAMFTQNGSISMEMIQEIAEGMFGEGD